jgi:GNAT superfamily N-acetyltransferase
MITLVENDISKQEYLYLRSKVGWRVLSDTQAELAISNSIYFLKAYDDENNLVGMGRLVGDGAVICYIQDLVVIPECQGRGVGSVIIEGLKQYAEGLRQDDTTMMLCLMCAKGREPFYLKHGFTARPTQDLGPGMIQYLT